jgi:hypothetical protein
MAVSMVRELKEADVVELNKEENSPIQRAWLMFDPLAADAQFPGSLNLAISDSLLTFGSSRLHRCSSPNYVLCHRPLEHSSAHRVVLRVYIPRFHFISIME